MPISQLGALNTTALTVPDLYVQIVPPQNLIPNGVPSNVIGYVGTATWGPTNRPVIVSNAADYQRNFGPIQARKYDLGTGVYIAAQQGANSFRCVRVTDGTDVGATYTYAAGISFTALYTGSYGNTITVYIAGGSKPATFKAVVNAAGNQAEVFDNIAGTGATLWANMVAAINNGGGSLRGPSQFITAATTGGTTTPSANGQTLNLSGGTDGTGSVTVATLVGADVTPRTGMYALRSQGCAIGVLADADDPTQWTVQGAFGLSEAVYMIVVAPAGSAITNGSSGTVDLRSTNGLDNYAVKLMHGDWLWWSDQVNNQLRLVSPQHFMAGKLGALAPQHSSLNKPIYGIVASQKSGSAGTSQNGQYSSAELSALFQAGIEVISNPAPGGGYWAARRGCNTSSNPATNGDNYTRLTNYIATSVAAVFGIFVGRIINQQLFREVTSALRAFLGNMADQGQISSPDGTTPYGVTCDTTNNLPTRTALGYLQADVQIVYGPIALYVILNLEGGQTVTVRRQITNSGQVVN